MSNESKTQDKVEAQTFETVALREAVDTVTKQGEHTREVTVEATKALPELTDQVSEMTQKAESIARLEIEGNAPRPVLVAAAERIIDIAIDEEAKRFADDVETHIREQASETHATTAVPELHHETELEVVLPVFEAEMQTAQDISYHEWLDEQLAKSREQSLGLMYEVETGVSDEAQEHSVPLAERFIDDGMVHTAVDMLVSETEQAGPSGMDEEQFMAELEKLFGEEGFLVVDTDEVEAQSSVDVSDAVDVLVERFEVSGEESGVLELDLSYEELSGELLEENVVIIKEFDEDGNEILFLVEAEALEAEAEADVVPMTQVIEERIHEVLASEPERFAELSEMDRPEVLFEEMTQIAEALQQLAAEQEFLDTDLAQTMELYEKRLAVVVEKLMLTLDPDFDPSDVSIIVEELITNDEGTHERKHEPDRDMPNDDAGPWWAVGVLAVRSQLALAA